MNQQKVQREFKASLVKLNFDKVSPSELTAVMRIYNEYLAARKKFAPFNSEYEAYGVILEELNEFWHLVQHHDKPWAGPEQMKSEIQAVGAMAVSYLIDIDKELGCTELEALGKIYDKYRCPNPKYPEVKSAHEAYAIILEEVDALWRLIKNTEPVFNGRHSKRQRIINIGLRALKFLIEM